MDFDAFYTMNKGDVPVYKTNINLVGVSGQLIEVAGKADISMKFGEFEQKHPVTLIKGFRHKFLLGRDFLARSDGIIDFKNNCISLEGRRSHFLHLSMRVQL